MPRHAHLSHKTREMALKDEMNAQLNNWNDIMSRTTTGQAKVLTDMQQRQVLAVLTKQREVCMFLLSVKAGLRALEIAGLQWRHVRGATLELTSDICKGSKPRSVNIGRQLRDALQEYRKECGEPSDTQYLFPNQKMKGYPVTPNAVSKWFKFIYCERLGWEGFSSHSGRRTAITKAARMVASVGGSLKDVQDMAGHASLETTQIYIDGNTPAKQKLAELL